MVGLAVVLIGPTACGSDDSSDASMSTQSAPPVQREAGATTMSVNLKVVNNSSGPANGRLCANGDDYGNWPSANCRYVNLEPGQSDSMAGDNAGGEFSSRATGGIYVKADNPWLGEPYFRLTFPPSTNPSKDYPLGEGESKDFGPYNVVISRAADTDYKEMTLTLKG